MSNYSVNYTVSVNTNDAIQSINNFNNAMKQFDKMFEPLTRMQKQMDAVANRFHFLTKKPLVLDIQTNKVNNKLDTVLGKLSKVQQTLTQINSIGLNLHTSGGTLAHTSLMSNNRTTPSPIRAVTSAPKTPLSIPKSKDNLVHMFAGRKTILPNNISYRALGPSMVDSGGLGAFEFVKGMGIAYGLSGVGTLFSKTINQATEYDNLMKTTRNILLAHDKLANFDNRFKEMEWLTRDVGVQTKFTAPQVADATKFLAMAGFNLEGIKDSIRPIADIALVGDTDLGQTADVVTNIMTGYGISPKKVRNAADVMTMTFTKSNTTLMEIAEAYKYAASLLSAGGVSFEEATSAIGILGDAGIKGSQAGTTMRTIMANIANPTKKQLSNWERIGVQRFDSSGDVRNLADIFEDLSYANLNVADFYKLFHKTAAQGAISLASNVEKWNEIINLNFMSGGMTSKLAEEKKETIAGLWAQLTSSFTELGLKAFEDMNNPIRYFLKDITSWLQGDEALTSIKRVSKAIYDLFGYFKTIGEIALTVYKRFGGLLEVWLKTQVVLAGIIAPLRVFKSLFNFTGFGVKAIQFLGAMNMRLGSMKQLLSDLAHFRIGAILNKAFGIEGGGANGGAQNSHPVIRQWIQEKGGSSNWKQRYRFAQFNQTPIGMATMGASALGGAFLGGMAGSYVGEQGSVLNALTTLGGGAAGAVATPWLISKAAPFLMGTVGVSVGVVAALGAMSYGYYKLRASVLESVDAHTEFLKSFSTVNGINYSENATLADKYYSIIYNNQLSVNEAIGRQISLMKEQLGIMDEVADKARKGNPYSETNKKDFDELDNITGFWKNTLLFSEPLSTALRKSQDNPLLQHYVKAIPGTAGDFYFKDENLGSSALERSKEHLLVAKHLYSLGRNTKEGSPLSKVIADFNKSIYGSANIEGLAVSLRQIQEYIESLQATPGTKELESSWLKKNSESDALKTFWAVKAQRDVLTEHFFGSSANKEAVSAFQKLLQAKEAGNPTDELAIDFLLKKGHPLLDSKKYGKLGSAEFLKHFGYDNGKWSPVEFPIATGQKDKNGNPIYSTRTLNPEQAQEMLLVEFARLKSGIMSFNSGIRQLFGGILEDPMWNMIRGFTNEPSDGEKQLVDGVRYKYDKSLGKWVAEGPVRDKDLTPQEMSKKLGERGNNDYNPLTSSNPIDQMAYQNHYQRSSVMPKQVIVKIENLMNVESIDLSKEDNKMAIDTIREQLAQVLVDAVRDFDDSYNS